MARLGSLVEDLLVQVFGDPGPEAPEALGWKPNVIARLEMQFTFSYDIRATFI